MSHTLRLAFVCSGNICRSPMAAVIAQHMLEERERAAVVISAGTLNLTGRPAARNARAAVAELGLDLSSHRSQGADARLLRFADHIVVMAPRHERALLRQDPSLSARIVRLWEHHPELELEQIDDPVGQDLEAFRACRDVIQASLESWLDEV